MRFIICSFIVSGVCTATSFSGNGAGLVGVASTDNINTSTNAVLSGIVTVAGDAARYVGNVLTYLATSGDAKLTAWINGWDAAAAGGNGNGTGADEFAGLLLLGVGQVPIGTITPEQSIYGGNLIFGYKQPLESCSSLW